MFRSHFYVIHNIMSLADKKKHHHPHPARESRNTCCENIPNNIIYEQKICTRTLYLDNSFQLTIYWLKPCRRLNIKIICICFIIIVIMCIYICLKKKERKSEIHFVQVSLPQFFRSSHNIIIITKYMIILFNGIIIADLILV